MPKKIHTNLIKVTVSIHPSHFARIEELLDNSSWGFSSQSDIVRQALSQFFRKVEPEYLKPSLNQELKAKELSEQEKFEAMTDEEYARSLGAFIGTLPKTGEVVAIIHWFYNTIKALSLEGFKKLPQDIIENHNTLQAKNPIAEEVVKQASWIKQTYGIIIGDEVPNQ